MFAVVVSVQQGHTAVAAMSRYTYIPASCFADWGGPLSTLGYAATLPQTRNCSLELGQQQQQKMKVVETMTQNVCLHRLHSAATCQSARVYHAVLAEHCLPPGLV
jgi:hypothetical protein